MFRALGRDVVARRPALLGVPLQFPGGVQVELFTVPGKVPLYLEEETVEAAQETGIETGINVGVEIRAGSTRAAYVPGAAGVTATMLHRLADADLILFDGTLFRDDEMIATGTGAKTGRRMGHMPIHGEGGSLTALASLAGRRIFIHINNTNPILVEGSPERLAVQESGWEVAEDGMELVLWS
jgi:pyrroloquinoline quinone biosynthesis protein B